MKRGVKSIVVRRSLKTLEEPYNIEETLTGATSPNGDGEKKARRLALLESVEALE